MKKVMCIIFLSICGFCQSGEVHLLNDDTIIIKKNCILNGQYHSDIYRINEYFVSCNNNNISNINDIDNAKSFVYFASPFNRINCHLNSALIGDKYDFFIILDCSKIIFSNDFN